MNYYQFSFHHFYWKDIRIYPKINKHKRAYAFVTIRKRMVFDKKIKQMRRRSSIEAYKFFIKCLINIFYMPQTCCLLLAKQTLRFIFNKKIFS